jgi:glutaredoxin 3
MAVRVYTTMFCGYCRAAEALLERNGIRFETIDVTHDPPARAALIRRANGRRTVPVIFAGDDVIGGYTELAALERAGKLHERLRADADTDVSAER